LTEEGTILALGRDGLQNIVGAEIVPFDEVNVDSKVRDAIRKWRNRDLDIAEKRKAIRELADVFEGLKKTGKLQQVLDAKDESALFEIANKFAIRHHNPNQNSNYDRSIWYSWIFHFYLATYHTVVRSLIKHEKKKQTVSAKRR
jgi:Arc/MetJ-type ribon-helix-helix transcriptional regulator